MANRIGKKAAEKVNHRYKKDTESKSKDFFYNKILDRYTNNGIEFSISDRFVWQGAIYTLPGIFGYMLFFSLFLYLAHLSFTRYGDARTIVFFILLVVWRLNVAVKYLAKLNEK